MQRYLWQQANGARHIYDTEQEKPREGRELTVLCGETVVPRTHEIHAGDLPIWFDPTCAACEERLARVGGWVRELAAVRAATRKGGTP